MANFGVSFLEVDSVQIVLKNVHFGEHIVLDEVQLNGSEIHLDIDKEAAQPVRVSSGETQFRALITEPNLNAFLERSQPADGPLKNLRLTLLSGKVKLTAQLNKIIKLPIVVEGVVRVENGVKVFLEWEQVHASGIPLPTQLVALLEQQLNKRLDLSISPFPVWLDWIRCEPGRITISGKARLNFPLKETVNSSPFSQLNILKSPDTAALQPVMEDAPYVQDRIIEAE